MRQECPPPCSGPILPGAKISALLAGALSPAAAAVSANDEARVTLQAGRRSSRVVVALQQAVAVFAVQSPVSPVERRVAVKIGDQTFEPLALAAGDRALDVGRSVVRTELAQPDGRRVGDADVAPIFAPDGIQAG